MFLAGSTAVAVRLSSSLTATSTETSLPGSSRACATTRSSSCLEILIAVWRLGAAGLPPDGRLEVLDLVDRQRVDAAGEVLPAVVGDDEHDVALVELARDAHRDRGDCAGRDAGEERLLVEQLACPHDRVAVGHEDLAIEQGDVDDRRDEAVVERAQAPDGRALHRLGGPRLGAPPRTPLEAAGAFPPG